MIIALIDDHKLLTDTIRQTLTSALPQPIDIITYNTPQAFLEKATFNPPDVVVSDMLMPTMNGMELWERCKVQFKEPVKFLFLTSVSDPRTIKLAIRSGVMGYISKESPLECLIEGVLALESNEQYLCPIIQKILVSSVFAEEQLVYQLSPREKEILAFLCTGKTVKEIAFELTLSVNTIQTYVKNIMRKFKINRTVDLVIYATQNGLV